MITKTHAWSPSIKQRWATTLRPVVEQVMRTQAVPGVVIAVAREAGAPEYLICGTDAAGQPLAADTLFPVASITKLATALAVLRLVGAGAVALDDPLARYLPEAAAAQPGVTIRALLCHTAGLPDDVAPETAPYTPDLEWSVLGRACLTTALIRPPHTRVHYSNVGPGLQALIVERVTGRPFTTALVDLVLAPLQIEGYLGSEPPRSPARVTGELGEHSGTKLEPFNSAFWRSLALPWGGLVTTALGALTLALAFAGVPSGFLPPALLDEAARDQTGGLSGGMTGIANWPRCPWGLGIALHGEKTPDFVPSDAAPTSFGHAGLSGCLVWVDPVHNVAWAILGTRTCERWWSDWSSIGAAILSLTR